MNIRTLLIFIVGLCGMSFQQLRAQPVVYVVSKHTTRVVYTKVATIFPGIYRWVPKDTLEWEFTQGGNSYSSQLWHLPSGAPQRSITIHFDWSDDFNEWHSTGIEEIPFYYGRGNQLTNIFDPPQFPLRYAGEMRTARNYVVVNDETKTVENSSFTACIDNTQSTTPWIVKVYCRSSKGSFHVNYRVAKRAISMFSITLSTARSETGSLKTPTWAEVSDIQVEETIDFSPQYQQAPVIQGYRSTGFPSVQTGRSL